jgi:hypothetical protein
MKLDMVAQTPENTDKRQIRRDPAEIGSNADAALLPVGPAAGSVDEGVLTPGASVDGEDPGERLTPTNFNRENENPAGFKLKYLFFHTQIIGY